MSAEGMSPPQLVELAAAQLQHLAVCAVRKIDKRRSLDDVAQDEASYDGDVVRIEPSWVWPKPARQPHPPIVLGGAAGPKTAAHVAEFCDGWMPIGAGQLKTGWEAVRRACEAVGRDPKSVEIGVFAAAPDEAELTDLVSLGTARAVLAMPQGQRGGVVAELERLAPLIDTMADA